MNKMVPVSMSRIRKMNGRLSRDGVGGTVCLSFERQDAHNRSQDEEPVENDPGDAIHRGISFRLS